MLLPGMDGTGRLFEPFVRALGAGTNVKIVRYPDNPALGYPQLAELVRHALPTEPFVLLGESFSGPVAIALAAEQPANLKGLVLCCTFARSPRPALGRLRPLLKVLPLFATPASLLGRVLFGSSRTPELIAAFSEALAHVSPSTLRERLRAVLSVDVSAKLKQVSVPLLYLRASGDQLVPASAGAHIKALQPGTREVSITAPHFLLQAAPEEAVLAVHPFLAEVSRAL